MTSRSYSFALIFIAGCSGYEPVLSTLETQAKPSTPTDPFTDGTGTVQTFAAGGTIDTTNPFFQSLGQNGRSCASCHVPSSAWTLTPSELQARFTATQGQDPVFRLIDGANAPNLDVSTLAARQAAYSQLLSKGLIRVGI